MMRKIFTAATAIAAVSFSQIALSQVEIRGRGVTGDVNVDQSTSQSTTTQQGTGNQSTTRQGTSNQSTTQQGDSNQSTTQQGTGEQSATQQGTVGEQSATQRQSPSQSAAGPTEDPNVTRDAKGREHTNKGKHKGQQMGKGNRKDAERSG